jgi:DNA-binding winged helix-turn-helix (wHTH) protein
MASQATHRFASRFELQPQERRLLVDGTPARLGTRAFDLLRVLAERHGQLVTKAQLMDLVWADVVVEENNVQHHIAALRKLLGPGVIETIPSHGYRFVAPLDDQAGSGAPRGGTSLPLEHKPGLKTNLPVALPRLIGRDQDLAALGALVDAHRLVTLAGAGGIGKSRLAQALLFERRNVDEHGVCLVELAAHRGAGRHCQRARRFRRRWR